MTAKNTSEDNNVLVGYPLVSRALRYTAKKLRMLKDDEGLKVRDELIMDGIEYNAERIEEIARAFDEQHIYLQTRPPPNEAPDILAEKDNRFSEPYKKIICFALKNYGNDLIQTKDAIPERYMSIKPTSEELRAFLKVDNIFYFMRRDYCGR